MAGHESQYDDVARELVQSEPDVIVTAGHPPAVAIKKATAQIPIVALAVVNPVGGGLAASISHPGGNLTGFSLEVTPETNAKMLELLHEAAPKLTRIGALWNSANPGSRFYLDAVKQAAQSQKLTLDAYDVRRAEDIDTVFRSLRGNVEGLVVFPEGLLWTYRRNIVDAAREAQLATIFGYRAPSSETLIVIKTIRSRRQSLRMRNVRKITDNARRQILSRRTKGMMCRVRAF
jgi:putative ABC transport system substrate-binding protein